jgi:hypothetical protein
VVQETLQGAIATQLLSPSDQVVSIFHRRLEHGYPTPSLGRDAVLSQALPWLQQAGIWSRGRFGSYKVRLHMNECEATGVLLRGVAIQLLCALHMAMHWHGMSYFACCIYQLFGTL